MINPITKTQENIWHFLKSFIIFPSLIVFSPTTSKPALIICHGLLIHFPIIL